MNVKYFALPFVAWLVCGSLKFVVNFFRSGKSIRKARHWIGYGGFPSTHTAVLSSAVFFVGFSLGFDTPVFTFGLGTLVILLMDAHGLRRKVGVQANAINASRRFVGMEAAPLRARMGHSWPQLGGGLAVGAVLGYAATLIG